MAEGYLKPEKKKGWKGEVKTHAGKYFVRTLWLNPGKEIG